MPHAVEIDQTVAPSAWMQHSLTLAAQALGVANPNPAVGCVIVGADGQLLGQGHTQPVGGPHAEVMALRDARARGHALAGATVYVTLEPCSHHGRTPPCCDALIAAGVARVVASLTDPNPKVGGQGFARLRAAGIAVEVGEGAEQARELNRGFLQRMETGRPWVRVKAAASLDGLTALPDGQSQWITGAPARHDGQRWRLRADVVLTGIGTVLADDPLLNVRDQAASRQPHLAIVDSQLRTPLSARLWTVPQRRVLVFGSSASGLAIADWRQRRAALEQCGAEIIDLPADDQGRRVDLAQALAALANEIHVEAGATLNGSLLRAGLVDEWLLYLAPTLLGAGRPIAAGTPFAALQEAPRYRVQTVERIGEDVCIRMRR